VTRFLRLYPVLSAGVVQAALACVVALGLHLTAGQTGAIEGAAAAVAALLTALAVRPFQVAALTGVLTALGTVLVAFGVHGASSSVVSAVNLMLAAVLAALTHGNVTPSAAPAAPQQSTVTAKT
jgi:hypothetical protein